MDVVGSRAKVRPVAKFSEPAGSEASIQTSDSRRVPDGCDKLERRRRDAQRRLLSDLEQLCRRGDKADPQKRISWPNMRQKGKGGQTRRPFRSHIQRRRLIATRAGRPRQAQGKATRGQPCTLRKRFRSLERHQTTRNALSYRQKGRRQRGRTMGA